MAELRRAGERDEVLAVLRRPRGRDGDALASQTVLSRAQKALARANSSPGLGPATARLACLGSAALARLATNPVLNVGGRSVGMRSFTKRRREILAGVPSPWQGST